MGYIKANVKVIFFVFLLFILFIPRFVFLDADINHDYLLGGTIDEIYYNEVATKILKNGIWYFHSSENSGVSLANANNFLLPNLLTLVFLKLLGNTFIGLRAASLLVSFLSVLCIASCARRLFKQTSIFVLVPLLYMLDFFSILISRSALSTSFNMLACSVLCLLYTLFREDRRLYFFLGFWSVFSICTIYFYNFFLLAATGCFYLFSVIGDAEKRKRWKKDASCLIAGAAAALIVCEILARIFVNRSVATILLDTFYAHSQKIQGGGGVISLVVVYIRNATHFFRSSMFAYNIANSALILFSFLLVLYNLINSMIKKRIFSGNSEYLFFALLFLMHWVQTVLMPNLTSNNKSYTSFPAILLLVGYGLQRIIAVTTETKTERKHMLCFMVLAILSALLIFVTLSGVKNPLGIFHSQKSVYQYIGFAFIASAFLITFIIHKKIIVLWLTCIISSVVSFVFFAPDTLFRPTYYDKAICQQLYSIVGDTPVIGGHAGLLLYESAGLNVLVQEYDHYKGRGYDWDYVYGKIAEYVNEYVDIYFLGYEDGMGIRQMQISYVQDEVLGKDFPCTFELVHTFPRSSGLNYCVYKKVMRNAK